MSPRGGYRLLQKKVLVYLRMEYLYQVLNNCREKNASEFFFFLFVFLTGKDAGIIYDGPALYP